MDPVTETHPAWVGFSEPLENADVLTAAVCLGALDVFWSHGPSGWSAAGVGVAQARAATEAGEVRATLEAVQHCQIEWAGGRPSTVAGPWFGGFAFDLQRASQGTWSGFPATRWVLPEILLTAREGFANVTVFERASGQNQAQASANARLRLNAIQRQLSNAKKAPFVRPNLSIKVEESRAAWDVLMTQGLRAIAEDGLEKVVLARALVLRQDTPFELPEILRRALSGGSNATVFLMRGTDRSAFVGVTPELLCRSEGQKFSTQALASSAPPENTQALALGDKEWREHRAVVESIRQALSPLAEHIAAPAEPQLLQLAYVAHLSTPVEVTLKPDVTAAQAILALSPTAAVGGTPRHAALEFLARHEGLNRGWYAGGVGWIGPRETYLNVGLRSALVHGSEAIVFVGAGIVDGSVASDEWRETELKAKPMLHALGVDRG